MNKLKFMFAFFFLAFPMTARAQQQAGITPCFAASLSVSGSSNNVQLGSCGAVVIVYNVASQEAFYNLGGSSAAAATTSNYSIPANSFVTLQINPNTTNWLAAITSTSTATLRVVQGAAFP